MKLEQEPKWRTWEERLAKSGCLIERVTPLSVQCKPSGELLFAYLDAQVTTPEGARLPSILFLRGDAVLIVTLLINNLTGKEFYLMVEQRRIATGDYNLEFPAGMIDRDTHRPSFVALKELAEETGLSLTEEHLFPLSTIPLYSSPGACDERIYYYGTICILSEDRIAALEGQLRIAQEENERIRVVLKTREEFLEENRSQQALLGHYLLDQYRKDHP